MTHSFSSGAIAHWLGSFSAGAVFQRCLSWARYVQHDLQNSARFPVEAANAHHVVGEWLSWLVLGCDTLHCQWWTAHFWLLAVCAGIKFFLLLGWAGWTLCKPSPSHPDFQAGFGGLVLDTVQRGRVQPFSRSQVPFARFASSAWACETLSVCWQHSSGRGPSLAPVLFNAVRF